MREKNRQLKTRKTSIGTISLFLTLKYGEIIKTEIKKRCAEIFAWVASCNEQPKRNAKKKVTKQRKQRNLFSSSGWIGERCDVLCRRKLVHFVLQHYYYYYCQRENEKSFSIRPDKYYLCDLWTIKHISFPRDFRSVLPTTIYGCVCVCGREANSVWLMPRSLCL